MIAARGLTLTIARGILVCLLMELATLGSVGPVVRAENPCVISAPHTAAEVRGHTWSGSVRRIAKFRGPDEWGVSWWHIVFKVGRVYADQPADTSDPYATTLSEAFAASLAPSFSVSCPRPSAALRSRSGEAVRPQCPKTARCLGWIRNHIAATATPTDTTRSSMPADVKATLTTSMKMLTPKTTNAPDQAQWRIVQSP